MRRKVLRVILDAPSIWCFRILCAISLAVTCALAIARSARVGWTALTTLLLILLGAINRLRIRSKFKRAPGTARRPKRERT